MVRSPTKTSFLPLLASVSLIFLLGCAGHSAPDSAHQQHEGAHHQKEGHSRRPADLQEYLAHLDRPERDAYQKPAKVIEALQLEPGMAVADLGSGSGYFTRRFVTALNGTGTVYAIDVEQEMLDYVRASLKGMPGGETVHFVLAEANDPGLPENSVDLVFICNVYHHLDNRPAYLQRVGASLRPGGRVAIIDFYHDQRSGDVGFPRRHLVARETVVDEMTNAGYKLANEHSFLERQYFLEFARPDQAR